MLRQIFALLFRFKKRWLPGFHPLRLPLLGPFLKALLPFTRESKVQINGQVLYLDPMDSLMLSVRPDYEPMLTRLFSQGVREGDWVLDIGANIGYFSLLFGQKVGAAGRVLAFEPEPENFKLLKKNLSQNGLSDTVRAEPFAVSDQATELTLYKNPQNAGDHRLHGSGSGTLVKTLRIDDYLGGDRQKIRWVKMDIQGHEWRAIKGMEKLLRENPDLVLTTEYWPQGISESGGDPQAYLADLRSMGFQIFCVDEDQEQLRALESSQDLVNRAGFEFLDLVCAKDAQKVLGIL